MTTRGRLQEIADEFGWPDAKLEPLMVFCSVNDPGPETYTRIPLAEFYLGVDPCKVRRLTEKLCGLLRHVWVRLSRDDVSRKRLQAVIVGRDSNDRYAGFRTGISSEG